LDGWTSKRGDSIFSYIVTTMERREYLIAVKNYSSKSHTGNFLAS
ncbi:1906_t:CDS:1, partial [Cetraspora pellucida]